MNSRLYISDLDGTLLNNKAELSVFSRSSIVEILKRDVGFTIATARSYTSTKEILGSLPFRLPVICSNGGSIYDYSSDRLLHVELIPPQTVKEVIIKMKAANDTAFVSSNIGGVEKVYYDSLPNKGMQWYFEDRLAAKDVRMTRIDDIREIVDLPVTTITFMNSFHHIDGVKKFYRKNFKASVKLNHFENKYSPGWYWLSLHSPKTNKAEAIKKFRELYQFNGRSLTVFGDELNDIQMFELADKAVAVDNAMPEVKRRAHKIIGSNEDDAVMKYILTSISQAGQSGFH